MAQRQQTNKSNSPITTKPNIPPLMRTTMAIEPAAHISRPICMKVFDIISNKIGANK